MKQAERYLDQQTGLYNKEETQRLINEYLALDKPGKHVLFVIDVDNYREINQIFGRTVGNTLIKDMSHKIKASFRNSDIVGRIGGDEFAAILPTVKSNSCERIREKLLQVNERLNHPDSDDIPVSLSMGVASSCSGYHDKLFEQADRAMYVVKENGRNGCLIYSEEMSAQ